MLDGRRLYVNNLLSLIFYRLPTHFTTCCDQEVGTECVVSSDLAPQRKSRHQFLAVLDSLFGKKNLFFSSAGNIWTHFSRRCFVPMGVSWQAGGGIEEIHRLHWEIPGQLKWQWPDGRRSEGKEYQELWPACLPTPPLPQWRNLYQVQGHLSHEISLNYWQ